MPELDDILNNVLKEYLNTVQEEIFAEQSSKGIRASGFSQQNTRVTIPQSGRAFLNAPQYLFTNFNRVGRRPGGWPPRQQIENWLRVKGLRFRDKRGRFIKRSSAAFLVQRKIGREGTNIYQRKKEGILIKEIIRKNLPTAGRKLAKQWATSFTNDVNKAINR